MKKILIYSSIGGGGHESARKAITAYLEKDYDISYEYMFDTTLAPMDPVRYATLNRYSGVRMYNNFIQKKLFRLINITYLLGHSYIRFFSRLIKRNVKKSLLKHKPDLVISVIPIVNDSIIKITKEYNIPFIVVPTDLDARAFVLGLKKPYPNNFYFTTAFNNNGIEATISSAEIPHDHIKVIGFPIRPEFFTIKDKNSIKHTYNIPDNKPIALLLMGAAGSFGSYEYAKQITKIKIPMHIIIVLGRNKYIKKKIEKITFPENISTTILGFTDDIADLMAIADLCITKSGTVSVIETIYSNLPVLLDATSHVLAWEQFNHNFVKRNHFGESIMSINTIPDKITKYISDTTKLNHIKKNIESFKKKKFDVEIKKIIEELINK